MRKPGLAQRYSGEKGAAGRTPRARPRYGSGSRRQCLHIPRQRPGPGGPGEGDRYQWDGGRSGTHLALGGWEARTACPTLLWRLPRSHTAMHRMSTWASWLRASVEISSEWPGQCCWAPECRSSTTTRQPYV